jgi:hypothetical protein
MMDYRKSHNFDKSIIAANLSQFDELDNESDEESRSSASDDEDKEEVAQEGSQKPSKRVSRELERLMRESLRVAGSSKKEKVERKRGGVDHKPNRESLARADMARSVMEKAVMKAPSKRGNNHAAWGKELDNVLNSSHATMPSSKDDIKWRRETKPPGLTKAKSERKHASSRNVEKTLGDSHLSSRMHASHRSLPTHVSDHSSSSTKEENSEPGRRRHPKQSPNVALSRGRSKKGMPTRRQKADLSPNRGKKDETTAKPFLGAGASELKW